MNNTGPKTITHIVLKTKNLSETSKFWEQVFEVKNRSLQANFLSYEINGFIINFLEDQKAPSAIPSIAHIGVELPSRQKLDEEFLRIKAVVDLDLKAPKGGLGQGPYRFYIEDPNGINLEFETWEGCSD